MRPLSFAALSFALSACSAAPPAVVVVATDAPFAEQLAAREVARYFWLRTGVLLPIVPGLDAARGGPAIQLATDATLPADTYELHTAATPRGPLLSITGGSPTAVLQASYRFAEHLGVRFSLHGDVVPTARLPAQLPWLDEQRQPLFKRRGIQPFHDFPEGPDWWDRDQYLAVLAQLPKLGMNFLGLHTYPEGAPNAEPLVWIGRAADADAEGRISASYPASWQNTLRGNWGYAAKPTSAFTHGTGMLFDRDAFGAEVMRDRCPQPDTAAAQNQLFDEVAALLRAVTTAAHQLGVEVCIGTETPLTVPQAVQQRLQAEGKSAQDPAVIEALYAAMFARIQQACPVDWYWLWTPEGWTWSGVKDAEVQRTLADLQAAVRARQSSGALFGLATCGWVLGPPQDRALFDRVLQKDVALSCINRQVGMAPVEPGFAAVQGRGKWAIPWLEDDPALTQPQLWAGRMRADARAAREYGCDGLLGIHWRTRVLAPNIEALAEAAWQQDWPDAEAPPAAAPGDGVDGGQSASFPDHQIAATDQPELYRTVRYDVDAYHFAVPPGRYRVRVQLCEPYYGEAGKRVFTVRVQDRVLAERLDLFAAVGKDRALDLTADDVLLRAGRLDITFDRVVEFPCVAAIEITGTADNGASITRRVNCGGPAARGYDADFVPAPPPPRGLPVESFYAGWAAAEVGGDAAPAAGALFARLDGKLPRPADWTDGPGGIKPDARPWDAVAPLYGFVDELAALAPLVHGAAEGERFDYWLHTFLYLRAMAQVACARGALDAAMAGVAAATGDARATLARNEALPARAALVEAIDAVYAHLLALISNTGELGTLANWEQHLLPALLDREADALVQALGKPLPPSALLSQRYDGPARVIVPTVRTTVAAGEALVLRVLVLSATPPSRAFCWVRPLGKATATRLPLQHVARGVYRVELPACLGDAIGFEYGVTAEFPDGAVAHFPVTAPDVGQSVVVTPGG